MSQEKFWNDNANNWAQVIEANLIASRAVTNAAIVNEIVNLKPQTALDIGCGEGWLTQVLTEKNINCIGIDGSQNLITIARQKRSGSFSCVNYTQIAERKWQPPHPIDIAVFNFSLLEENLTDLLKKTTEFLTPQGHLLIQTLHPKNLVEYRDGWNEEDFKTMSIPFNGKMPWYGRTLESWKLLFTECSLNLVKTTEPDLNGKPSSVIFVLKKI
ncbi:class I SAM-dependent methyltransferase [Pseudobdellovibrio sp. HCB154]|uniref:class I SAM-dependent methyltransferase n=1 Tax=Pseudobdellovibrio sp. HCB154 TaxID=3386277 RepID=UPI003916F496